MLPRLLFLTLLVTGNSLVAEPDPYESLLNDDFIENTTFRFRTKFNRKYLETGPDEFKTLISHKVDVPPLIDGLLEDDCWKTADHTKTAFTQWRTKDATRKQTVIYVCHDDKNLYMAVVCEEPSLKTARMLSNHPMGHVSWTTSGRGDCIQQFLELGGVGGTGRVFQFIYNIYPQVRYDGLYPPYVPYIGTGFKLGGSMGGNRWICELSYPYEGFQTEKASDRGINFRYQGPPRRGEIWGMRIMRLGHTSPNQPERMASCWNHNPTGQHVVPFPTGIIVFEDVNALHNGSMNEIDPKTKHPRHWNLLRSSDLVVADLRFDEDEGHARLTAETKSADEIVQVIQKAGVLPNVGYRLKARLKKLGVEGKITAGILQPFVQHEFKSEGKWETCKLDFFTGPIQREVTMFLTVSGGSASAAIESISLEQQIYGAPKGATCLTGNSPRTDLNLDAKSLADVKYTYLEPETDKERFPFRKQWTPGWTNGVPDQGGTTGWIDATKSSLTRLDLQNVMVEWSYPLPSGATRNPYPKGHVILFDMGKDYFIRRVELLPVGVIENIVIHIRPEESHEYILNSKLRGEGVLNPSGPLLYGRVQKIDSVGRFVKIRFVPHGKIGHAIYFIRIWGEEKGEHKEVRRFQWKEGLVVPEREYRQFRKLEGPVLMPAPQEVDWSGGEFTVQDGTPVYFQKQTRSEAIVNCLVEEVESMFGIRLKPVEEEGNESAKNAPGAIVLGEIRSDSLASELAKNRGWKINAERPGPQGYYLSSRPDGILICGYDQAGTFYGVQTLLQLLVRSRSGAVARGVEIRDWPYIPWRAIDFRGPGGPTKPFLRALARMKANVIKSDIGSGAVRKMCDDHFFFTPGVMAGHTRGSPIEMNDDENWHYLGMGPGAYRRICACPSHYGRYEFYETRAGSTAIRAGVHEVNINTDEMCHTGSGARWLADRRCLRRAMTGDELFTEMVIRAYDLFRLHHIRTAMLDTMLCASWEGGNGSYFDMYKARPRIPEDIHIYSWKGFIGQESSFPEEAVRRFERVTMLQGSFPFEHRGRINEAYGAPEGRRVQGIWNTVWGAAGPIDQVLAGQFCRSMPMVDGGSIIPFMCQGWNPNSPPVHTEKWAHRIGYLQQRIGEIVLERELPSWREGIEKEFFKVDIRAACNWSHIDPVPGDGKDWLDWGSNNDLRRMPRGEVRFEEVPFNVIDPNNNGGKSIVMVASRTKTARLSVPERSREIPVGRRAASLMFLRTNVGGGHLPGYRITYEGGRFLAVPLDAMGNASRRYSCYGLYAPGETSGAPDNPHANFKRAKHRMIELFSLFFRPAWLGTTGAGDPVKVTLHEWVNPYPELAIESVSIRCPPGRQSGRKEALFAITGVTPTQRDFEIWKGRRRMPLVPVNAIDIEPSDTPVMPEDGAWLEEEGDPKTWLDADGRKVCEVSGFYRPGKWVNNRNLFKRQDNVRLGNGATIKLARPQVCKKVALSGLFYWENHSPKIYYGVTSFRRTDYVLEVSSDGRTWTEIGRKQGICGEDGAHVHPLPANPIQYVRVRLDGSRYVSQRSRSASSGPGLTWLQLYR